MMMVTTAAKRNDAIEKTAVVAKSVKNKIK